MVGSGVRTPSVHSIPQRVIDHIFENCEVKGDDECWPWKLSLGNHGYGQIGWGVGNNKNAGTTAHRVAWIAVNGDIPEGDTVDHKCRNRPCINPNHLRLLSNLENATDNGQGTKTHCPRNHEYNEENTYIDPGGGRRCRRCAKITRAEWEEKRKAA